MNKTGYLTMVMLSFIVGGLIGYYYLGNNGNDNSNSSDRSIILYKSKYCGCCNLYTEYLESEGFRVEVKVVDNLKAEHEMFGIPDNYSSCHISETNGYFIVGHVPVEAIEKLLKEKPSIKGISLPGMPPGSPGMPGDKEKPFTVYGLSDSGVTVFMKL